MQGAHQTNVRNLSGQAHHRKVVCRIEGNLWRGNFSLHQHKTAPASVSEHSRVLIINLLSSHQFSNHPLYTFKDNYEL